MAVCRRRRSPSDGVKGRLVRRWVVCGFTVAITASPAYTQTVAWSSAAAAHAHRVFPLSFVMCRHCLKNIHIPQTRWIFCFLFSPSAQSLIVSLSAYSARIAICYSNLSVRPSVCDVEVSYGHIGLDWNTSKIISSICRPQHHVRKGTPEILAGIRVGYIPDGILIYSFIFSSVYAVNVK